MREQVDVFDDRPLTLERIAELKKWGEGFIAEHERKEPESAANEAAETPATNVPVRKAPTFTQVAHGA